MGKLLSCVTLLFWSFTTTSESFHNPLNIAHLVQNNPVRIDLSVAFRVQHHRLIRPEVGQGDLSVLGTDVNPVNHLVLIKVGFAHVSNAIIWGKKTDDA